MALWMKLILSVLACMEARKTAFLLRDKGCKVSSDPIRFYYNFFSIERSAIDFFCKRCTVKFSTKSVSLEPKKMRNYIKIKLRNFKTSIFQLLRLTDDL